MARYGNTILTSAGLDLAKRTVNGTSTFKITRVVTSSDSTLQNATIEQVMGLTSLNSIVQTGTVTAFDTSDPKQIGLKAQFVNHGLTDQYKIFAVGIYAQEAGKSEILYAVTPAVDPETMPARPSDSEASFTFTLQIYVAVANSSSVTISATTEGVVKSINGTIKPDTNGNVVIDDSSHAKFIEAELINGHLLVPLVDDSGNPITDSAGNQLIADEYLPKSVMLGSHQAIYPDADNTVRLPVYTQAEIDNRLEAKADLLQMEDEHDALQSQITDNTSHLGDVDNALSQHATQIGQATGEASYALDQISTGQTLTALSDGQGSYLTDEHGNTLLTTSARVNAIKLGGQTYTPDSAGSVTLDTYSKQEINNLIDSLKLAAKAYTDTAKSDLTTALNNNYYPKNDIDSKLSAKLDASKAWTPTVINTAVDLNTLKTCGSYFIQNTLGTTSNTPIPNSWLFVRVEGVPTRITQTVWKDIDPVNQWVRFYTDTNSWGNWVQITKAI